MFLRIGDGYSPVVYVKGEQGWTLVNVESQKLLPHKEWEISKYFNIRVKYCSCSGAHIELYLTPKEGTVWFMPGTYRVDVGKTYRQSFSSTQELSVYVPTSSHGGATWEVNDSYYGRRQFPLVVVKRLEAETWVCFFGRNSFPGCVENLTQPSKSWEFNWVNKEGIMVKHTVKFSNNAELYNNTRKNLNPMMFLPWDRFWVPEAYGRSLAGRKTNITKDETGKYLLLNPKWGYVEKILPEFPPTPGTMVHEWVYEGSGCWSHPYMENGDQFVDLFCEVARKDLGLDYPEADTFVEYELNKIPALDWILKREETLKNLQGWTKGKATKDLEAYQEAKILHGEKNQTWETFVEEHKDLVLSLQDSLDAGNCYSGTLEFMNKYDILSGLTLGEIYGLENWDELSQNVMFRKVCLLANKKKGK